MRMPGWLEDAVMWVVLSPLLAVGLVLWVFLEYLPFRWRTHRLVRGGCEASWERLTRLWAEAPAVYGSLFGPIENEALEAFIRRYPRSDAVVRRGLASDNPYVCAYALRVCWRLKVTRGERFAPGDVPKDLLDRADPITQHFCCQTWETTLGAFAREHLPPPTGRS